MILPCCRSLLKKAKPGFDLAGGHCQCGDVSHQYPARSRRIRISFLEDRQAAIAWKIDETGRFSLLDVVAAEIPPLAAILGGLGIAPGSVEVLFRPDKLGWTGAPQPLRGRYGADAARARQRHPEFSGDAVADGGFLKLSRLFPGSISGVKAAAGGA